MEANNKLKILLITVRADFGGGPEHVFQLLKYLIPDFDFYIAAPQDYPYFEKYSEIVGKEKMIVIPHRKFRLAVLFKLNRFVCKNKISLIHSHGKGAGIYSRILGAFSRVKVIHTLHGFHIGYYNSLQKYAYLLVEKILGIFTNKFINVSNGENLQISGFNIAPQSKFIVIENGVEITKKSVPKEVYQNYPKQIISLSRFDYAKNSELLIPIILRLRENNVICSFSFLILGSGPNKNFIAKQLDDNQLNDFCKMPGSVIETQDYLLNSFCYISTSRWEGLPLGVLEAMSVGLPVIATNVVGNNDVIENGVDGFLYDLNNPEEAVTAILRLFNDTELWHRISFNAKNKVEKKYNVKRMALETKSIYLNI
jgi:glycosyltransferase involved in cell wall biosynthesis